MVALLLVLAAVPVILTVVTSPAAGAPDSARTGYDAGSGATNLSTDWETTVSDVIDDVATTEGAVYATMVNHGFGGGTSLVAYDTDGTQRWNLTLDSDRGNPLLATGPDGAAYVSAEGGVAAYETNGTKRWSAAGCDCGGDSRPLVTDRVVYLVADSDGQATLFALDRSTGDTLWQESLPAAAGGVPADPLAARDGTVYAAVPGTGLVAYERDGAQRFRQKLSAPSDHPVATPNGTVLVTSDGTLAALDVKNGSVVWERNTGSATAPAVAPDGTVVAPTASNEGYNSGYGIATYDPGGGEIADWFQSTLDPGELDVRDQPLLTDGGLVVLSGGNDYSPAVHVLQRNGQPVDMIAPEPGFGRVSPLGSGRVLLVRGYQLRAVGSGTGGGSDTAVDASLTVDRFPAPGDPLPVSANATGVGTLGYEWSVNGSAVDCASATCELDVDYPASVSLTVTDAEGSTATTSAVVRASAVELDAVGDVPADASGTLEVLAADPVPLVADTSAVGHELDGLSWSVDGPADRTRNGTDGLDVAFAGPGRYNVTVTAELTDPASGKTGTVAATRTVRAYDLRESMDRFEFVYAGAADSYRGRIVAAKIQDRLPEAYRQIEQRTDGLPEPVTIRLVHPETRDACLICAGDGTVYHRVDRGTSVRIDTLRHELVHLAQDYMNAQQDGDWNTLIEGHASHEESPTVDDVQRKPSRSAFLDWEGTSTEYAQASAFVSAFYAEYGRQAFLGLLRDSTPGTMHARFESVTGESFEAFYADWAPTDPDREIGWMPAFTYRDGRLSAVVSDSLCWETGRCSLPEFIDASWDLDGDGSYEATGAEVSWRPETAGEHAITLRYERANATIAQTQTLRVDPAGPPGVVARYDPDSDGSVTIEGLGRAATDFAAGDLSLDELDRVATAFASG